MHDLVDGEGRDLRVRMRRLVVGQLALMRVSQTSSSSFGRAFSAGKLPTMPALHCAITSSGTHTMNSGAPITGRRRLSRSNGGRAIGVPFFVLVRRILAAAGGGSAWRSGIV